MKEKRAECEEEKAEWGRRRGRRWEGEAESRDRKRRKSVGKKEGAKKSEQGRQRAPENGEGGRPDAEGGAAEVHLEVSYLNLKSLCNLNNVVSILGIVGGGRW